MKPKKIFIYCCPLIFTIASYGQNYNPYKLIKKKAKVVTAYGNKFTEVFDATDVQRMGSVLVNIHTRKIVKMLNTDSLAKKAADNSISGRWYSIDPLAETQVSWSPYHFVYNNPIKFVDPNGLEGMNFDISSSGDNNKNKNFDFLSPKGKETFEDHGKINTNGLDGTQYIASTHTDENGNVISEHNDGDLGVYRHDKYSVTKIGETQDWDEFIDPATGLPSGKILFGESWDQTITEVHWKAMTTDLIEIAKKSKSHQEFDIKENKAIAPAGVMTGRLLDGKYASARSAGNYLAGLNAHRGQLFGMHFSWETYMKLAGALQQNKFNIVSAFNIITTGVSFGPAPYYGEINYTGRMTKRGWYSTMH